jgi:hypothetical protein
MFLLICFHPCLQVFIVAVLAIIPLVPKNLSSRASRLSFMGTACSSLYSLYALHGVTKNTYALVSFFPFLSYNSYFSVLSSCYYSCCYSSLTRVLSFVETQSMELAGYSSLLAVNNCDQRFYLHHLLPYICHFTSLPQM